MYIYIMMTTKIQVMLQINSVDIDVSRLMKSVFDRNFDRAHHPQHWGNEYSAQRHADITSTAVEHEIRISPVVRVEAHMQLLVQKHLLVSSALVTAHVLAAPASVQWP